LRTKTVPFGTKVGGVVHDVEGQVMVVLGDDNEGYVLVGSGSAGKPGDRGELEFRKGGPMGGYWQFTPEVAG
jgi:hypothetical protein